MNSTRVVLKTSPLAQDGYWWEGIWVQILPWQTDCIIVHIGHLAPAIQVEAVVVEPGGKNRTTWGWCHQKHIAWIKRTGGTIQFVLSGLAEPG